MSKYLDPKVLMAIKDLSLAARTTVDGFMAGMHSSNVKGTGMEFSQYRSYQAGDDLRGLDWKMYARSDRYYIRESEIETSISVRVLVDASASMNHADGGFAKLNYAKYLAASLIYLANLQGDSVGLYSCRDSAIFSMPSKKDHQHLIRLYYHLEHLSAAGKFTEQVQLQNIFSGSQKKELLVFITDLYQQQNELSSLVEMLAAMQHEVIVLHIMANNEIELDYKGYENFEDLETGIRVRLDADTSRKIYKQRLEEYLAAVKMQLLDKNIYYRLMLINKPVDKALRDFLNHRNKIKA